MSKQKQTSKKVMAHALANPDTLAKLIELSEAIKAAQVAGAVGAAGGQPPELPVVRAVAGVAADGQCPIGRSDFPDGGAEHHPGFCAGAAF